jgi:hypothetical protein
LGVLLTGLCFGSPAAWATSLLPALTSSTECTSSSGLPTDSGSTLCSQSGAGEDDAAVTVLPFVGLSANAMSTPGVGSFTATANLQYSFEVVGGNAGDQVPLLIQTSLFTSATPDAIAYSSLLVTTSLVSDQQIVECTDITDCSSSNFSGTVSVAATSGSIDTLSFEIEASAGFTITDNQYAHASADPLIYVDPSFSGADNYSILLSDGVGNGIAPAPEPGTFILMCLAGMIISLASRHHATQNPDHPRVRPHGIGPK